MRVLWVNPSFLDYRIAVYRELNELLDGQLTVVYSKNRIPERVIHKVEKTLGAGAIGLSGERKLEFGRKRENWANSFVRIPYQPRLLRTLMKLKADVILAEGFFQWTPVALLKSILQNIPIAVIYERTHHTERKCPRWRSAYRKSVMPFLDAMLCSGTECAKYSESLGMPAARISKGHMSAGTEEMRRNMERVTAEQRENIRSEWRIEGIAFIFAGRLIELKGLRELLSAWKRFERSHPGAGTLLIAGDGVLREELEATVRTENLRWVRFLGHVEYDHISAFYAAADIFVFPTLEDNWALVIPEAMACGLPILCSQYNGGAGDLIREGENGWIFNPLDEKKFINRLSECLEQRHRLREMGYQSLKIIASHGPSHAAASIVEGCKMAIVYHSGRRRKGRETGGQD